MNSPIDLVLAGDRHVAMQLATTIASAVCSLRAGESLRVFVLADGYDARTRARVEALRVGPTPEFHWLDMDGAQVPTPPASSGLRRAACFRLLVGDLLPHDVRRVVYLDTDVILVAPLAELAGSDLEDAILGAVPDANAPWLALAAGCASWRTLGIPPDAPYFNSGVLVIDLERWRVNDVRSAALDFIRSHPEAMRTADQDALNMTLVGRWRPLDRSWNQPASVHRDHGLVHVRWSTAEVDELRSRARLVHFTRGLERPWIDPTKHPLAHLWFEALDATDWAGWRPSPTATRGRTLGCWRSLLRDTHRFRLR